MNRSREYARVLLGKARDDQYVLARLVDDAGAPPWTLGFHAQQAVEKAIKAVLSAGHVEYPKTHDIQRLLGLASSAGLPLPPQAAQLPLLIPLWSRPALR
ncbi:MAG: HEPN domain-containing protein [Planctomycetota bacterium]|nr:HEPN domain-containing protein [Planctomycetota bacterium]